MVDQEREELGEKKEEGERGEGDAGETRGGLRDFRQLTPDYSLERQYGLRPQGGMIGERLIPRDDVVTERERPSGEGGAGPTHELPDITKDTQGYAERMVREFGVRGAIPDVNVDPRLLEIQERNRFARWSQKDHEALVDPKAMASTERLYDTYKELGKVPIARSYESYRDTYVPYSQNFLDPSLRGTIYGRGFINDPDQRNYNLNIAQSKYSSDWYYNLDLRESFEDYYTREFGVNNSFVPGSASRFFEINTLKQWADFYQRDYGVNIRTGNYTYSDWYRLHTSKPGR
jgi:hypothetical protein